MKIHPKAREEYIETHEDPGTETTLDPPILRILEKEGLVKVIQQQSELMEEMLKVQKEQAASYNALSRDILDVLKQTYNRQVTLDVSNKAIPVAPATSSSGWSPLLRAHLERIQPTVDRWRGTLDTLLVFIALFSAIVTTFFVQSLTGLSQDTGARTNELLQNFTDIYIAVNAANASQLSFSPPIQFEPEDSAVRLNFYWSIALILSISVASLAVTSRGYVAMLSRSEHRAAHQKLGDLHRRWGQAERLLAPTVELLPQLLIIPVLLFVVGLLDNIISSAIPISRVFLPILAAGLLSCTFALVVAVYTGWTVLHGCLHPEISPFQSTLARLIISYGTPLNHALKSTYASLVVHWRSWMRALLNLVVGPQNYADRPWNLMEAGSTTHIPPRGNDADTALTAYEIDAYHSALQQTHEDIIVDQAAAIFQSIILQRHFVLYGGINQNEFSSLCFMLSDEASIRTNVTAAQFIVGLDYKFSRNFLSDQENSISLLTLLMKSAKRYSLSLTGMEHSHILWKCPFVHAMLTVVVSGAHGRYEYREIFVNAPVIGMLLYALPINRFQNADLASLSSRKITVIEFLLAVVQNKLMESTSQGLSDTFDLSMVRFVEPEYSYIWPERYMSNPVVSFDTAVHSIFALGLVRRLHFHGKTLRALVHWLVERSHEAQLDFFGLALKALSMNLDRTFAQWRTAPDLHSVANSRRLVWLSFLWSTMNSSFTRKYSAIHPPNPEWCVDLLRLCSDTVQFFQEVESMENDKELGFFRRLLLQHQRGSVPHNLSCTPLCFFRSDIRHSLLLIHEGDPTLRLDKDSWKSLVSALGQTAADIFEPWSADPARLVLWTPPAHRNGIQRSVLEMLRKFSPDTPVTTVDKNDALCSDVTIPWEWLEGPDLGLVEEPEHVEDDGLEG